MKKTTFLFVFILLAAGIVWLNSCQKENAVQQPQNTTVTDEAANEAMLQHILDFKQRMENCKAHPGLRDGESFTAPDAVYELEALLNFNFCYTGITCNKKEFVTSQVTMPLDEMGEIGESKLAQLYYDEIIDSIQARMLSLTGYDNMKLLLVDLKQTGTDENGDAVVQINALVGNEKSVSSTDEVGYWYGELMGTCQHEGLGITDATVVLTNDIYFYNFPAPPPGKRRVKTDIITLPVYKPEDYFLVPENERDNFEDSRLFYANDIYGTITDDTRCLSGYSGDVSEMTFYLDSYQQFIDDAEVENNLDLTECTISWYYHITDENIQDRIWHELTITLGHVWLVDDAVPVDDILAY